MSRVADKNEPTMTKADWEALAKLQANGHVDAKGNMTAELKALADERNAASAAARAAENRPSRTATTRTADQPSRAATLNELELPATTSAEPTWHGMNKSEWERVQRLVDNGHVDRSGNMTPELARASKLNQELPAVTRIPKPGNDKAEGSGFGDILDPRNFDSSNGTETLENLFNNPGESLYEATDQWGTYIDPIFGAVFFDPIFGHEKTEGTKRRINGETVLDHNPTFNRLQYGEDNLGDIKRKDHKSDYDAQIKKEVMGEDVVGLISAFASSFAATMYGPQNPQMAEQWTNILVDLFSRSPLRGAELYNYVRANLESAINELNTGQQL